MADFNQALPTQFPDLGALLQAMPAFGAMQAGEQSRFASQNNQSLQDAFARQQEYDAQKRPLDLEALMASTENTKSMSGLHNANARQVGLQSDVLEGTKESTMGATNASNRNKISQADLDQTSQFGELLGQVAARTATAPPMMRAQIAKEMLKGHLQDHPELDNLLVTNANALPQYFKDMSDNIFNLSGKARAEQLKEERELAREEQKGKNAKEVMQMQIDAGRFDKNASGSGKAPPTEAEIVAKLGYEKAAVYYLQKADEEKAAGNADKAAFYAEKADKMKIAKSYDILLRSQGQQAGKVDVGQVAGLPTNPAPVPQGFSSAAPQGKVPVIRPDGKKGFIPADQLDEAIKAGYKKAQ